MSDSICLKCGGLIMEQGKCYGYAGKACQCVLPRYVTDPMFVPQKDDTELTRLKRQVEVLREGLGEVAYASHIVTEADCAAAAKEALAAADRIAKGCNHRWDTSVSGRAKCCDCGEWKEQPHD